MIYEYDDIDIVIVWETVKNDLPLLVDSLKNILAYKINLIIPGTSKVIPSRI